MQDVAAPRLAARLALVVACLASLSWLLGPVLSPRLDPYRSFASELSAADQHYRWVFRAADLTMGLCLSVFGLFGVRTRGGRRWRLGACGFLLAGVATMADAFSPMDCSTSISVDCRVAEETGRVSLSHQAHNLTSVLVIIGIAAAMVMVTPMLGRTRVVAVVSGWGWAGLQLLTVASYFDVPGPLDPSTLGLWQRSGLAAGTLWWLCVGVDTHHLTSDRRPGGSGPRPEGSTGRPRPESGHRSGCP